jgi:YbgC/YbaW family acyl-CoA thioester hydrolase
MQIAEVELAIYPDDCDTFGQVSQSAFLRLFERARWEGLSPHLGADIFQRYGCWPTVRKTIIDFHAPVHFGDRLRFQQSLIHLGRTSLTIRQTARRGPAATLIATAEFVLVYVDREGQPVPVPPEVARAFKVEPSSEPIDRLTVNGVRLAIESRGNGPAVLFLHGFPLDRTMFRHQLDTLSGFRRIALDLRGMGQSDAPDLGYSMSTYAEDVMAVLDALGEERVVVCGLSLGGYVAFELVRRFRHRVRGLILMDTRAEADSVEGRKARDTLIGRVRELGPIAAAEAMLPRFFASTVPEETIQRVRELILRTPVAGIVGALTAMRERPDSTSILPTLVGVPTLVLVGRDDIITPPAIAQAMASVIPEARLVEIPGAGHLPSIEQPVPTTRAILKFLQGLR